MHELPSSNEEDRLSRTYNTSIFIIPGSILTNSIYRKTHLFDLTLPHLALRESKWTIPGASLTLPFTIPGTDGGIKIGSQICFDLRFPEPAAWLRSRGANVLLYPSAWTIPTGQAGHWETLLRARALETQSWVIASAQGGVHFDYGEGKRRESWGRGIVVNAWGEVVVMFEGQEEGIKIVEIDAVMVDKVRKEMLPLKKRV